MHHFKVLDTFSTGTALDYDEDHYTSHHTPYDAKVLINSSHSIYIYKKINNSITV